MDGFDAMGPDFDYNFDSKGDSLAEIIDGALNEADEALVKLVEDPELTAVTRFLKPRVSRTNMVSGNLTAMLDLFAGLVHGAVREPGAEVVHESDNNDRTDLVEPGRS